MLGRSNVLLRGCQLRNTEWVLGLVLSTGTDTKINYSEEMSAPTKSGHTMKLVNQHTAVLVVLLLGICLGGAFGNTGFVYSFPHEEPWYIPGEEQRQEYDFDDWALLTGTYFLLNYAVLPVSLWVSATMVNAAMTWCAREDGRTGKEA